MFYLTLPSNSSLDFFPDNTLTHYHTKLPQDINLNGNWEAGLVEIQYPHMWYNVREEEAWFRIKTHSDGMLYKVALKTGYYESAAKLIRCMNGVKDMLPEEHKVLFLYDDTTTKVTIDIEFGAFVELSPVLQSILGMNNQEIGIGRHEGTRVVDVDRGFYSLYIYCSLLEPRLVGDSLVPLLRIVPIRGKDGDMITKIYENVHYMPVQQKHFNTVEIDIRNDTGRKVPFERGKVIVTLHFRKKRGLFVD
jgi:hypothetical protein